MSHAAQQHRSEEFTQTHWTQVALAAMEDGSEVARQALERLCTRYWPALYGYLRRQGRLPAVVCRFRECYRELVRRTVQVTVADVEEVDSEFQELFR